MPRREFLQLADTYNPAKHKIARWLVSEKLDGTRCFWDGGISRGVPTAEVPWASVTDPKTGKPKGKIKPVATGLWSRYGNPIMAPRKFLDSLPPVFLDGELWAGRGKFQLCRSICAGDEPDPRFDQIKYAVYSLPPADCLLSDGEIKNANMRVVIDRWNALKWVQDRCRIMRDPLAQPISGSDPFEAEWEALGKLLPIAGYVGDPREFTGVCFRHAQLKLDDNEESAQRKLQKVLDLVLDSGGEGVVLRNPNAVWTPKRHRGLLKHKPFCDAEAQIDGFIAGREGKQGNVLGKIGALIVRYGDIEFEIGSGLTFEQREFLTPFDTDYAASHPGERMPDDTQGRHFQLGHTITFKYRELSDDNIPKEARVWRKREGVE